MFCIYSLIRGKHTEVLTPAEPQSKNLRLHGFVFWFCFCKDPPRWFQWQRSNLPMQEALETQIQCLGLEDSQEKGTWYPLQYSCPKNPMDRGAWWATVHRIAESDTTKAA